MTWASDLVSDDGMEAEVSFVGWSELFRDLEERLAARRGFAVATMNLDHAVKLRRMPAMRAAYRAQSHVTADGRPVVWLEWLAGRRAALVPGSDLVLPLAAIAARLDVPVALVGASDAVLEGAARALNRHSPGLRVVQKTAPRMGFDPLGRDGTEVIEALRHSGARFCFLAVGAPRQEIFAARARRELPHVGFVSVGAGLDFLAGTQRRAPQAMRALCMEWSWRLASDPRRMAPRYGACAALLPLLVLQVLRRHFARTEGRA